MPPAPEAPSRKTKIVCTIGPATSSEERLRELMEAGMNVARLNFSHGTRPEHGMLIDRIRKVSADLGLAVAVLQDLPGPKVRIGPVANGPVALSPGDLFTLTTRQVPGDEREVSVSYAGLPEEVSKGDRLLLADGKIALEVLGVSGTDVSCRVQTGGALGSHKGVNLPSGLPGLPILGEKDVEDLRFGMRHHVDYLGVSFVRTADDLRVVKKEIAKHGSTPVIAKIETHAALESFDAILAEADGVMVARGDLGIETPFTRVPVVQKRLIREANRHAVPVITATQMLYSMVESPTPTRAEVNDVANAVVDGSDAVMLSEETSVGKHPVAAVRTMASIAADTENESWAARLGPAQEPIEEGPGAASDTIARAACEVAESLGVDAIGTITLSGWTARFVAKYRPRQPILAVTPRPETYRRLALVRGVTPLLMKEQSADREDLMRAARGAVRRMGWKGMRVVFVSSDSSGRHLLSVGEI